MGISYIYSEFASGSASRGPAERLCHLGSHELLQELHVFRRSDDRCLCRKEFLTICRHPAKERFGIQKEHLLAEISIWHIDLLERGNAKIQINRKGFNDCFSLTAVELINGARCSI